MLQEIIIKYFVDNKVEKNNIRAKYLITYPQKINFTHAVKVFITIALKCLFFYKGDEAGSGKTILVFCESEVLRKINFVMLSKKDLYYAIKFCKDKNIICFEGRGLWSFNQNYVKLKLVPDSLYDAPNLEHRQTE